MKYTNKQIDKLLEGIASGEITQLNLPDDLYYAIADYLKKELYKGFGGDLVTFSEAAEDLELLTNLRENTYLFAGAKTFQFVDEAVNLLVDHETGELRSTSDFISQAKSLYDQYNVQWLEAEGITTVSAAQGARRWNDIQARKDVLPNLRYSTIGDACQICAPLDKFTAPADSPKWFFIFVPNHFCCLCVIEQDGPDVELTPEDEADEIYDRVTGKMSDVFKNNPGVTGEIWNKEHPYFDVPKQYVDTAKNNFGLDIPDKDTK